MGAPYPNAILDIVDATPMGMHSGIDPTLLPKTQLAFAINVTSRGGHPGTRPALRKVALYFADDDSETNAQEALFQGASYYEGYGNNSNYIIASIGGRLFRYAPGPTNTAQVQDISVPGDLNSPVAPQAWLFQGEDFLIINDGLSYPLFFDGSATRRSLGPGGGELPTGAMGTYSNGRIVMALPDRRSYIAGDLVYGNGAGGIYNGRDAILKTNENAAILGGAAFAVPISAGPINAMFSVAIPDTSLGQGPLQIGTRKGVFGVNLPLDASTWTTLQFPTQVVSLPSFGPLSHYSVSVVNGDAWYRSADGIRSFAVARRDFNTWVQTPLSFEMNRVLPYDTDQLLGYASSVNFNNRLLMTCSPHSVTGRGVAHRGLIALDFNNISSLTTRSNPDYDGLWTGLEILQVVCGSFQNKERCFIFALDSANKICLYELMSDSSEEVSDYNGTDEVQIESSIETNALFGLDGTPPQVKFPLKKLITSDLFLENILGQLDVTIQWKSDQDFLWRDWHEFSLCATAENCPDPAAPCTPFENVQPMYATFRRMPEPPDTCSELTGRPLRTGYYFQIKLSWAGHAKLHRMMVWAVPTPETVNVACADEPCVLLTACGDNLFSYSIEG